MLRTEPYSTSSIGASWPPTIATQNRLRGLYPAVVDTPRRMSRFIQEFIYHRARMPAIDRVSIKHVGTVEALHLLRNKGIRIEGIIPLASDRSHYLIYTGWNSPTRIMRAGDIDRHRTLLEHTRTQQLRDHNIYLAADALSLRVQLLSRATPPARRECEIPRLHRTFDRTEQDITELVLDVGNTIAYLVAPDDSVICSAIGEQARIPISGHGELNLYEITEGATRADYQGRGLYRELSAFLVDIIRDESPVPIDAIYGECNLASPGVVYAARQNGRRFVYDDRNLYGITQFDDFGILGRNYRVNAEPTEYNDFALTYIDLR